MATRGTARGTQGNHDAQGRRQARLWESCSSSPVHAPLALRTIALFSLMFACALLAPTQAQAATWPLASSVLSYSCGFHATYTAGASTYTHSGMDVPGTAGCTVSTPLAGTVTYVGSVPSGDARVGSATAANATMKAVSVRIADGRTITLMPFASVSVARGDVLAEGEAVGTLAASGDVSTAATHLHMGLKRDGTYYDPMTLFGASSTSSGAAEEAERASAATAAESAVAASAAASGAATSTATESAAETASSAEGVQAEEATAADAATEATTEATTEAATEAETTSDTSTQAQQEWGTISSGQVAYLPQTESSQSIAQRIGYALQPLAQACLTQLQGLLGALRALANVTGVPLVAVSLAAAALALAACGALGVLAVRRVAPAVASALQTRRRARVGLT